MGGSLHTQITGEQTGALLKNLPEDSFGPVHFHFCRRDAQIRGERPVADRSHPSCRLFAHHHRRVYHRARRSISTWRGRPPCLEQTSRRRGTRVRRRAPRVGRRTRVWTG